MCWIICLEGWILDERNLNSKYFRLVQLLFLKFFIFYCFILFYHGFYVEQNYVVCSLSTDLNIVYNIYFRACFYFISWLTFSLFLILLLNNFFARQKVKIRLWNHKRVVGTREGWCSLSSFDYAISFNNFLPSIPFAFHFYWIAK